MTIADTINITKTNIKDIKEWLAHIEDNNTYHSERLANKPLNQPLDDIDNSLAFIKDYYEITSDVANLIKDYWDLH